MPQSRWTWHREPDRIIGTFSPWRVYCSDPEGREWMTVTLMQRGHVVHTLHLPTYPDQTFSDLTSRLASVADRFRDPLKKGR